jgi:hypothetical protein
MDYNLNYSAAGVVSAGVGLAVGAVVSAGADISVLAGTALLSILIL